jgi:cell division septation protein DedD
MRQKYSLKMTPLLLDQRSIFKAGIAVSLGMLAVFSTGYYLGLQNAGFSGSIGLNRTIALALPKPAHADTNESEAELLEVQPAGAIIDVDSSAADVTAQKTADALKVENAIQHTKGPGSIVTADEEPTPQLETRLQLASLAIPAQVLNNANETTSKLHDARPVDLADVQPSKALADDARQSLITDTATAEDARYTIQVGVFADSDNAVRRVEELEALNLSAYTQGYANKRNQLRFNVRFGYFRDKADAVAALNHFERELSGSGYVTRIRRD